MSPVKTMEISHLPYDCIRQIIEPNFPLKKLVRLRAVCKIWQEVVEDICHNKKKLYLFNYTFSMVRHYRDMAHYQLTRNEDFVTNSPKNLLPILLTLSNNREVPDLIIRLFPKVTHLVCGLENYDNVAILLFRWSGSLVNVTLTGKLAAKKQLQRYLWDAIESMSQLKRLHLHDISPVEFDIRVPYACYIPHNVAIFKQLEHLAITGRYNQMYRIFGFKKPFYNFQLHDPPIPVKRQNEQLFAHLTHLVLTDQRRECVSDMPIVKLVLQKITAIRYLDISDLDIKIITLLPELRRRTNLTSMRLKTSQFRSDPNTIPMEVAFRRYGLTSIKRLQLIDASKKFVEMWGDFNFEFDNPQQAYKLLELAFPSLEHLEITAQSAYQLRHVHKYIPGSVKVSFIYTDDKK